MRMDALCSSLNNNNQKKAGTMISMRHRRRQRVGECRWCITSSLLLLVLATISPIVLANEQHPQPMSSLLRGSSSTNAHNKLITDTANSNSKHPSNFLRWRSRTLNEDEAKLVTNEDYNNNTGIHVTLFPFQLQLSPIIALPPTTTPSLLSTAATDDDEDELMASHMETLRLLIEEHLNQTLSTIPVFSTSEFDVNAGGEFAFVSVDEIKLVKVVPIEEDEELVRTRRRHLQNDNDNEEVYSSSIMTVEITGGQAFYLYGPGGLFMSAIPNPTLLQSMINESLEQNNVLLDGTNAQLNSKGGGVLAAKLRESGGIIFDSVQSVQVMDIIMPDVIEVSQLPDDLSESVIELPLPIDEIDDLSESVIELPLPTDEIEAAVVPTAEASAATQTTTVASSTTASTTTTATTVASTTAAASTTAKATTAQTTTSSTKAITSQTTNVAQVVEEAEVVTAATTTPSTTQAITEIVVVQDDDTKDITTKASSSSSSSADEVPDLSENVIELPLPTDEIEAATTDTTTSKGTNTNNLGRDEPLINSLSNSNKTPPLDTLTSSKSESNNAKNIILAGSISIVLALLVGAALFIQRRRRQNSSKDGEDEGSSRSVRMTRLSDEDDLEYDGFNSFGKDVESAGGGGGVGYKAGVLVATGVLATKGGNTNKRASSPGIDSEQTSQVHNLTSRRVSDAGGLQNTDHGANIMNHDEGNAVGDTSFEQGALQIIAPALPPQAILSDNVKGGDSQEEKDEDFDKMLANAALASGAAAAATMSRRKSNNGPLAENDSLKPAVDTSYGIDTTIASSDDFNADHHQLGKISQFDVIASENRQVLDDMGNPVTGNEDLVYDDIDEAMDLAARTTSRGETAPSPIDFAGANNNNNENDLFNNNIIDSMGSHDILNDINQAAILHKRSVDKVDKARGENTASPFSTTSSSYIGLLEELGEEVVTQSLPAEDNEQPMKDNECMASHDILDTINKVAQSSRMLHDENGPLLGSSPITPSFRTNAVSPSTIQRDPPGTTLTMSDPPGDNATLISDDDHDGNGSDDETDLFAELRTVESGTDAYTGTIETRSAFTGMDTALVEEFEKNEITSSYGASGPLCSFQARSFACKMEKKDDDGAHRALSLSGMIEKSWDRISSKSHLPPQFEATVVSDEEGSDSSDDGNNISRPWKDKWDDPFTLSNTKQAANARMISPSFHNAKDTSLSDLEGESNYGTDSDWDVDDTEMDDFELRGHGEDDFEASTVGEKNAPMRIW